MLYFPLPPWGTISPRLIHKLHLAAVSPLPEETTLPSCGRPSTKETPGRMPDSPALRIFVRPSLADACPARAQHGRDHPIPSRPPPMTEVRAASLPSPPCPFQRASFNRHVPADGLFLTSPRLVPVSAEPAALRRGFQFLPFGTFPFHDSPTETTFPRLKRHRKKFFFAESSRQNRSADRRRLSSKSPAAQAMSDVAAKRPPQKRTQNMEEYPRVKK